MDKQITVLMYHRVDAVDTDPWGICVAPHVFEEHIRYLKSHYPLISINEVVQQVATGEIEQHSICITFDDGYADNYACAVPILEKYNCPATFFIPTAFIGSAQPFWWDELEYIFLHLPQLPRSLSLVIDGQNYTYTLNDHQLTGQQWQQHQSWKWYDDPPTDRCAVFLAVWESLRPLHQLAIEQHLAILRTWADSAISTYLRLPMDKRQLHSLFSNSLFTAGLHTHTHPDLSTKSKEVQLAEIERGNSILQESYKHGISYLAYPYGRYNEATIEAVKELNLTACFTTEAIPVTAKSNTNTLGRYQVCNWDLDAFRKNLKL